METFLERSLSHCKVQVEQVEWKTKETLKISEIHLSNKEGVEVLHISEALLTTPTSTWISWLLMPSTKLLSLRSVEVHVKTGDPLSLGPPHPPFSMTVDAFSIFQSDGTKKTFPYTS